MYQQGSGLANKSVAVSKLIGNTLGDGLAGKSMLSNESGVQNKSTRKVEGHDLAKTTKTNFEQTVNNLKSKPNQKVLEDEYINVVWTLGRDSKRRSSTWSTS